MEKSSFDMAILGAGCSSFQMLYQLSLQPHWSLKNVALFTDNAPQQRSWCFWSTDKHPLQHLVTKSWRNITFKGSDFSKTENVEPYQYQYIPGEGFFNYFQQEFLPNNKNITVLNNSVTSLKKNNAGYSIQSNNKQWLSESVFSSLTPSTDNIHGKFWLKQHFKGWFIKAEQPIFDDTTVTLMDFSIPQKNDTRFVYILPFSSHEALMEMTVFSPLMYPDFVYEDVLNAYMSQHFLGVSFTIEGTEKGQIPMTDALFSRFGTEGEVLIGTAAGMVKATTGYAFKRISRDSEQLAEDLINHKKLRWSATKGRFRFYDRLLLGIIAEEPLRASLIFETLFKKVPITTIFRFLDEETHLWEELHLFSQLPFVPFFRQIYRQWMR